MSGRIREFAIEDYDRVLALWQGSEGLVLRAVDEREPIRRYLEQNPGLSFVWEDGRTIAGAVLCGTDGRRGYLQHLAVAVEHRRRGIGRTLTWLPNDTVKPSLDRHWHEGAIMSFRR